MINIFFISYLITIFPVIFFIKLSRNLKFLICIFFLILIFFLRDPTAASDYINYTKIASYENQYFGGIKAYSPLYWQLNNFLVRNLNLSSSFTVNLLCSIPGILISIISFLLSSPLSFATYLSSETFPLLSFNGLRQGLSISFLIGSLGTLYYLFEVNLKNYAKIIFYSISLLLLLCSAGSHLSMLIFLSLIIFSYISKSLFLSLIKLKIKKKKLGFIILFIILISASIITRSSFNISDYLITRLAALQESSVLSEGDSLDKMNLLSAFYRIGWMIIFSLYFLKKSSKLELKNNKSILFLRNFISYANFAFIPILMVGFFSPLLFSRFSHYCIVPIYFSIVGLKRFEQNRLKIYLLILCMGAITYNYPSVLKNLII